MAKKAKKKSVTKKAKAPIKKKPQVSKSVKKKAKKLKGFRPSANVAGGKSYSKVAYEVLEKTGNRAKAIKKLKELGCSSAAAVVSKMGIKLGLFETRGEKESKTVTKEKPVVKKKPLTKKKPVIKKSVVKKKSVEKVQPKAKVQPKKGKKIPKKVKKEKVKETEAEEIELEEELADSELLEEEDYEI